MEKTSHCLLRTVVASLILFPGCAAEDDGEECVEVLTPVGSADEETFLGVSVTELVASADTPTTRMLDWSTDASEEGASVRVFPVDFTTPIDVSLTYVGGDMKLVDYEERRACPPHLRAEVLLDVQVGDGSFSEQLPAVLTGGDERYPPVVIAAFDPASLTGTFETQENIEYDEITYTIEQRWSDSLVSPAGRLVAAVDKCKTCDRGGDCPCSTKRFFLAEW